MAPARDIYLVRLSSSACMAICASAAETFPSECLGMLFSRKKPADLQNFKRLRANTEKIKEIQSVRLAVSNGLLHRGKIQGEGIYCQVVPDKEGDIDFTSLNDITSIFPLHKELILKLDCEGAEYDVLCYASGITIRRYKTIFMELHRDRNKPYDFLKDYLTFLGYELVSNNGMYNWTYGPGGKVLSCERIDFDVLKFQRKQKFPDVYGGQP